MPDIAPYRRFSIRHTPRGSFRTELELVPSRGMSRDFETGQIFVWNAAMDRCFGPVRRRDLNKPLSSFRLVPLELASLPEEFRGEILRETPRRWRKVAAYAIA